MKHLVVYLVVVFSFLVINSVKANDIRDFELEGISVGDTLLAYLNKDEIQNNNNNYFKNKKYTSVRLNIESKSFDQIDVAFLTEDKNYIIQGLSGIILYNNNHEKCMKDRTKYINDLNDLFKKELEEDIARINEGERKHTADLESNSAVYFYAIGFETTDFIVVSCVYIDPESDKDNIGHFRADIYTAEYDYFLSYEAY